MESRAQLGNVTKVKLVLMMAREVAMLRKHFDSVTLVFAHVVRTRDRNGM